MRKYRMFYYLPGQSKLFQAPQVYETTDPYELDRKLDMAYDQGCDVVAVETVESQRLRVPYT